MTRGINSNNLMQRSSLAVAKLRLSSPAGISKQESQATNKQLQNANASTLIENENLKSIIQNLLMSSPLLDVVRKNLKQTDAENKEKEPQINPVEAITSNVTFISAVVDNLKDCLITNEEFCKAINMKIEKKVEKEVSKSNQK